MPISFPFDYNEHTLTIKRGGSRTHGPTGALPTDCRPTRPHPVQADRSARPIAGRDRPDRGRVRGPQAGPTTRASKGINPIRAVTHAKRQAPVAIVTCVCLIQTTVLARRDPEIPEGGCFPGKNRPNNPISEINVSATHHHDGLMRLPLRSRVGRGPGDGRGRPGRSAGDALGLCGL